uniref:Reverse transcriptase zinc-binding domain-containing protein n=1 Tax=Oryza meridionalis TaxID=40149 RepID=A0A0E0CFA9_9ORYZ
MVGDEDCEHLFVSCPYTNRAWRMINGWIGVGFVLPTESGTPLTARCCLFAGWFEKRKVHNQRHSADFQFGSIEEKVVIWREARALGLSCLPSISLICPTAGDHRSPPAMASQEAAVRRPRHVDERRFRSRAARRPRPPTRSGSEQIPGVGVPLGSLLMISSLSYSRWEFSEAMTFLISELLQNNKLENSVVPKAKKVLTGFIKKSNGSSGSDIGKGKTSARIGYC